MGLNPSSVKTQPIYIFIFVLLVIFIIWYIQFDGFNVEYIKSTIDNEYYLVQSDQDNKPQAANLLAKIKSSLLALSDHVYKLSQTTYKSYAPYIIQLHNRIGNVVIQEGPADGVNTSYSVNKGEKIVFCIRSRKLKNQLHKLNLMMYVAIHELAHVACPEYGHTDLFNHIFAFLAKVAVDIGVYERIDFRTNPTECCGLVISDSII